MTEKPGNIWDYFDRTGFVVVITTNGFVKKSGDAVMGRGVAFQATQKIRGIAKELGGKIKRLGNAPHWLSKDRVLSFPVKHMFWESADLALIRESAETLKNLAANHPDLVFVMPHPGCHNGKRNWEKEVKPLLKTVILPDNVWIVDLAEEVDES